MTDLERVILSDKDLALLASDLNRGQTYHIPGTNSISVPSQRKKFLSEKAVRRWPDLNGEIVWATPGEAARWELKRHFPIRRVGAWRKAHMPLWKWPPPMVYTGPYEAVAGVWVDLTSAYWQIYRWLQLDCVFPRGRGMLWLMGVADVLHEWKAARNAVVGVTRSRTVVARKGGKSITHHVDNPWLTPHLWGQIQGVLHEIAWLALRAGAVYVNTDGFLFLREEEAWQFRHSLDGFGLSYHDISGGLSIRGWNSYKIGRRSTAPYRAGFRTDGGLNNVKAAEGLRNISHWQRCRDVGEGIVAGFGHHSRYGSTRCDAEGVPAETDEWLGGLPESPGAVPDHEAPAAGCNESGDQGVPRRNVAGTYEQRRLF